MDQRNGGITSGALLVGRGAERVTSLMPAGGRIVQEANARRKASGYADVDTGWQQAEA